MRDVGKKANPIASGIVVSVRSSSVRSLDSAVLFPLNPLDSTIALRFPHRAIEPSNFPHFSPDTIRPAYARG